MYQNKAWNLKTILVYNFCPTYVDLAFKISQLRFPLGTKNSFFFQNFSNLLFLVSLVKNHPIADAIVVLLLASTLPQSIVDVRFLRLFGRPWITSKSLHSLHQNQKRRQQIKKEERNEIRKKGKCMNRPANSLLLLLRSSHK